MKGFVIGHPRSGTQFVSELLCGGVPGVSGHEVLVDLAPGLISAATDWYEQRCDRQAVLAVLDRYRDATPVIDSNWKLSWILPLLLETFPEARLLHLVREPRANVRSCVELDYYGTLVDDPRFPASDELRHWLRTNPSVRRPDWPTLDSFERNCAFWNETHRLIDAGLHGHPRMRRVRVEDLARDAEVRELFDFFEVTMPPPPALAAVRAQRINTKVGEKHDVAALRPRAWTPEDDARVWSHCGQRAAAYGYAQ